MWLESLPRLCGPQQGESGMGFCLRAVALNGGNLHWLRRAAGVPYGKSLTRHNANRVAAILGCSPDWLGTGLATPERLNGRTTHSFLGQRFTAGSRLRRNRPQVCSRCVHRDGFCRSAWELGLVTACELHQCALVDRCAACCATLRWDRPAVDVCHCGKPISSNAVRVSREEFGLGWSRLLVAKLAGELIERDEWASLGLPDLLLQLSADGLLAVLHAFGACAVPYSRIGSSTSTRSMSTGEWTYVGTRAWSRLQEMNRQPEGEWCKLAPVINQGMLGRLAERAATTADAAVANRLLRVLFGSTEASRYTFNNRQLELFD